MLFFVATPIGNLDDLSRRALNVLREADVIACEDTRRTWRLLSRFGIPRPARMISYREQTEERETPRLLSLAAEGRSVAVCTDSGFPGLSDPGYRLAAAAAEQHLPFSVIPGPSAVHVALLLSGLPMSSYIFLGYPPRRPSALSEFFRSERERRHTLVLFESPRRVAQTLQVAAEAMGDRRAAVCVEMTKKFERVTRGFLSELAETFGKEPLRGEVTVVIAGNHPKFCRSGSEGRGSSSGRGGPKGRSGEQVTEGQDACAAEASG